MTNSEIIENWVKCRGRDHWATQNGSLFYNNFDVIYSYGNHFPLCVRMRNNIYLCNGDRYSITTTKHQGLIMKHVPEHRRFILPFKLFDISRIDFRTFIPDYRLDFELMDFDREDGILFRIDNRYYLSGYEDKRWFLIKLAVTGIPPYTVDEGYNCMKHSEVIKRELKDKEDGVLSSIRKQGDLFFVDTGCNKIENLMIDFQYFQGKDSIMKKILISHPRLGEDDCNDPNRIMISSGIIHYPFERTVTEGCFIGNDLVVRGTVKHIHGYNPLNLGKNWWIVYSNIQEKSYYIGK